MLGIGFFEILIIALVAFIALGPKQLPVVMRKLAGLYRQFVNLRDEFRLQVFNLEEEEKKNSQNIINMPENKNIGNKNG
jgi:sec-independent protein translocase protein TatB